jgi:hypothetical protein
MSLFLYKVVSTEMGGPISWKTPIRRCSLRSGRQPLRQRKPLEMHEHGDFTQVKVKDGPLGWRTELVINGRYGGGEAA